MVNRRISDDLKEAALRMKNRGRDTNTEIAQIMGFSKLFRAQRRKRATGSVAKAQAVGRGRPRSLATADAIYLLQMARHKPDLFLDEYAKRLQQHRYLSVHLTTIHRTLERAGLTVKRVQKLASERSPEQRADFFRRIGRYQTECLISLDEVSKDNHTYARLWGRSTKGERVDIQAPFVRKRRFSMVAALALGEGIIASQVVEGSFVHDTFYEFLRDDVVRLSF